MIEAPELAGLDARLVDMTPAERTEHLLTVIACALTRAKPHEVAPWLPDPMAVFNV